MGKYSPIFKHNILTQYASQQHKKGFHSLASQYKIQGGASTIKRCYDKWNGTIKSLERRIGSGRKSLLNEQQVKQYISNTNSKEKSNTHTKIHYPTIQKSIQSKLNKTSSLRTIQRYGQQQRIKIKRTKKVMKQERKYKYIIK